MFSWMNAGQFSHRLDSNTPADEAVLDALVDDELDDDRRREFLLRMDKEPSGWRRVAMRFLQRQVERRAVRDLMGAAPAQLSPAPKTPSTFVRWYPALRVAAAVALVLGLVGLFTNQPAGQHPVAPVAPRLGTQVQKTLASVPARRQLQFFPGPASQFLGASDNGGLNPQYGGNIRRTASRILLVPQGGNRVVAYPVAPLNAKGVPLY